ncbi:hypothetical protein E5K00_15720 [Hymenobacter aquaticus]|uniref:Peptidase S74 domain-containing protein n=1 Tax=Hymenobacter aquaticus TaxID=1867101 RepID=A0A4Z0PWM7_9BACT|nr:tail fiber domain-containing protein [Hymenobacter aquaticus]TGE21719.1 hypothetical protein E5K00_15720 [Hymenobacter aquaticus]
MKTHYRLLLAALLLSPAAAHAQTTPGVGIGVAVPLSRLHVAGGSVLFSTAGDVSGNALPLTGEGRRLLWYADKAAFRVGYVGSYGSNYWDDANIGLYSFATGYNPLASGQYSFAAGNATTASGEAAVALGRYGTASGLRSMGFNGNASAEGAIALGTGTLATGPEAVALGPSAVSQGIASICIGSSTVSVGYSVAIGLSNLVTGQFGTAIGKNARVAHQGAMTLGDASAGFSNDYVTSTTNNQMTMRFAGGYRLITSRRGNSPTTFETGPITGVELTAGAGSWTTLSDRRAKENFRPLDAEQVLRKVAALPITEWNYKSQPATQRHIGPMAQDFYQAFRLDGIGRDTTINTVDIDGVSMVAIQALEKRTAQLQQENEQLRAQLRHKDEQLAQQLRTLNERLAALEQPATRPARRKPNGVPQNVAAN